MPVGLEECKEAGEGVGKWAFKIAAVAAVLVARISMAREMKVVGLGTPRYVLCLSALF